MKEIKLLIFLSLILLVFTQCKPETDKKIYVSLGVASVPATKTVITPQTGAAVGTLSVEWTSSDIIYVVGEVDKYLGVLELTSGAGSSQATFAGTIDALSVQQDLHFYYVGNNTIDETSAQVTINLANQSAGTLANIASGMQVMHGVMTDVGVGVKEFSTSLSNMIAIALFDLSAFQNDVRMYGTNVYSSCVIDLGTGLFITSNSTMATNYANGIELENAANQYIALAPTTNVVITFDDQTKKYSFVSPSVNSMLFYSDDGNDLGFPGTLEGAFSVSATRQVCFSQGNLQYQASTNSWRFASNQYDVIRSGNVNISSTYNGWIDLFGWGTSGWNNTANDIYAVYYQPWDTSTAEVNVNYNTYGYGPSYNMTDLNLTGTSANYDWGIYNPILNGGYTSGLWRTLAESEWAYLITKRPNASTLIGLGSVGGVNGLILLPDDWSLPSGLTFNSGFSSWTLNSYTLEQWLLIEAANAVFLPIQGYRAKNVLFNTSSGYYWTSTDEPLYGNISAYSLMIRQSLTMEVFTARCYGLSVRLVRDVQ